MDLLCWARYVSICSIYFICQKVAIDFCHFRSFARANDANIVRSRDAQCKTRESP